MATEREIAQQFQEKYEIYLLSLVFTLLALAIQTASFGPILVKSALELLGWCAFLISGLAGLWRHQWIPWFRVDLSEQAKFAADLAQTKAMQSRGVAEILIASTNEAQSVEERIRKLGDSLRAYDDVVSRRERRLGRAYDVHQYAFVVGLVLALCARGYEPALQIGKVLVSMWH
jgi:hypothetical protein